LMFYAGHRRLKSSILRRGREARTGYPRAMDLMLRAGGGIE